MMCVHVSVCAPPSGTVGCTFHFTFLSLILPCLMPSSSFMYHAAGLVLSSLYYLSSFPPSFAREFSGGSDPMQPCLPSE